MRRHDEKVALITGAGGGIGRALALEAAARGIDVIVAGRRAPALAETVDLIAYHTDGAVQAKPIAADVTRPVDRARLIDVAGSRFGRIDYLINNAGRIDVGAFSDTGDDEMAALLAVNVAAPASLIRDALPLLRRASRPRIVNVGSMFGSVAFPRFAAYSATKFAMRGLSDALRRELRPDGIGVTYAAPRATRTPAAGRFEALAGPMGMTFDTPEKVAKTIWRGVLSGKNTIYPGPVERIGAWLAVLAPGLLDRQLGGIEEKLRISPPESGETEAAPERAA